MGVHIGITHGDVEQFDALFAKLLQKPNGLLGLKFGSAFGGYTEAVGMGEPVLYVQTGGYDKVGGTYLHGAGNAFPQQAGTVF